MGKDDKHRDPVERQREVDRKTSLLRQKMKSSKAALSEALDAGNRSACYRYLGDYWEAHESLEALLLGSLP